MKYLTAAVVTACLLFGAFSLFDLSGALEPPVRAMPINTAFAFAGEWVTNPDGRRVCKLSQPLSTGRFASIGMCDEWIGAKPFEGQQVPWLRSNRGFGQIHIEGEWRP